MPRLSAVDLLVWLVLLAVLVFAASREFPRLAQRAATHPPAAAENGGQ